MHLLKALVEILSTQMHTELIFSPEMENGLAALQYMYIAMVVKCNWNI